MSSCKKFAVQIFFTFGQPIGILIHQAMCGMGANIDISLGFVCSPHMICFPSYMISCVNCRRFCVYLLIWTKHIHKDCEFICICIRENNYWWSVSLGIPITFSKPICLDWIVVLLKPAFVYQKMSPGTPIVWLHYYFTFLTILFGLKTDPNLSVYNL